jgi:hypothetical protein
LKPFSVLFLFGMMYNSIVEAGFSICTYEEKLMNMLVCLRSEYSMLKLGSKLSYSLVCPWSFLMCCSYMHAELHVDGWMPGISCGINGLCPFMPLRKLPL